MSKTSHKTIFKGTEIVWKIKTIQSFIIINKQHFRTGNHPRGHSHLHWCDVITKELKDHNIRKELAGDQVQQERVIKSREMQLYRVWPIRDGQGR